MSFSLTKKSSERGRDEPLLWFASYKRNVVDLFGIYDLFGFDYVYALMWLTGLILKQSAILRFLHIPVPTLFSS